MSSEQSQSVQRPAFDHELVRAISAYFPGEQNENRLAMIEALLKGDEVLGSVQDPLVVARESKLKLVLMQNKDLLTEKWTWVEPFGLVIAFLATLLAADFKDFLGLRADIWETVFVLLLAGSVVLFSQRLCVSHKAGREGGVDGLLRKIKDE